jgi:hypothetical protein
MLSEGFKPLACERGFWFEIFRVFYCVNQLVSLLFTEPPIFKAPVVYEIADVLANLLIFQNKLRTGSCVIGEAVFYLVQLIVPFFQTVSIIFENKSKVLFV